MLFFSVVAQEPSTWTTQAPFFPPDDISGSHGVNALVTDSGGNLHVLSGGTRFQDDLPATYYSRWTGKGWTEPVDVMIPGPIAAVIDDHDVIHVILDGFSYTQVHASQAANTRVWRSAASIPTEKTLFTLAIGGSALVVDNQDILHIVYGDRELRTIAHLQSADGGLSWQEQTVYGEENPSVGVAYPSITTTPGGNLIVTWMQVTMDSAQQGRLWGAQSSQSTDGGNTWTAPEKIVAGYYQASHFNLGNALARTVSGGIGTGGRSVSFSHDDGITWTPTTEIGLGGMEGMQAVSVIQDGTGRHYFIEQTDGMFAMVPWDGAVWYPPILLPDPCCDDPQNPVGAITQGNQLHLFWAPTNGARQTWYARYLLPVASLPTHTLTEPTTVATATARVVAESRPDTLPAVTKASTDLAPDVVQDRPATHSPGLLPLLVFGILPAFFLVAVVALGNAIRRNR